ncbi:MAG: phospholipase D family protein [Bacteroidia bacterium]|nr:phospholipase D family protein [Bacteroidia bacterium]
MNIKLNFAVSITSLLLAGCSNPSPEDEASVLSNHCTNIHRNDSITLDTVFLPLTDSIQNKTGVYVLEDGGGSMVTRAWFSEYAEKSIDVQYFIFSTDNVGLIACDYLVRAADRGVKVRILVDDIMVEAGVHDILMMDSHENISIKVYNPGTNLGKNICEKIGKLKLDFKGANQRMHNKTFTVDGKVSITGGRNIADEYFDYDHEYNFRDRDVMLIGKTANVIQNSFNTFWESKLSVAVTDLVSAEGEKFTDPKRFDKLHEYACNPDNFWPQVRERVNNFPQTVKEWNVSGEIAWLDTVGFVSDVPGKNNKWQDMHAGGVSTDALVALVNKAKKSIMIQSPYLITTAEGTALFAAAVKRGVKVQILTNSLASTDNLDAFSGYQSCRADLLKAGVHIYEFRPDAAIRYKVMTGALQKKLNYKPVFGLHAKSMVVDGETTVIGTFNLDPRSANLNCECVSIIHSQKIAAGVSKGMEEEIKPENAWHTTLEFNPDGIAGIDKNKKALQRRIVPKEIL